ncbi:MAG: restriction endonuclease [Candidatus Nitrospinota bacterium M3_3B_026]
MAIPDFQTFLLPFLRFASDGKEHTMQEARDALAKECKLSEADLAELVPSGRQTKFANRVAWSKVYLGRAGLLDSPKRGVFLISERGRNVLEKKPERIDIKFLMQFPEYQKFREAGKETKPKKVTTAPAEPESTTPEETLEQAYEQLHEKVANELLEQVKNCSPYFFEKLVVNLLLNMGYGGSREDAGRAIGKTGDEGIDGIINEDKLGLDVIYIQAKRWNDAVVGRREIQQFVGALSGKQAKKGIFITTSGFSKGARDYAEKVDSKVILIDGEHLASLMIDHNVGVSTVDSYEIKKIDSDYFFEE